MAMARSLSEQRAFLDEASCVVVSFERRWPNGFTPVTTYRVN
jgi:hypothetical protein